MELLKKKIKTDYIESIRNKDVIRKNILIVVLGELDRNDKANPVKIIEKLISSNQLCIEKGNHSKTYTNGILTKENIILNEYLPRKLTGLELTEFIDNNLPAITHIGKDTGLILGKIKSRGFRCNGKEVNEILSSRLQND